MFWKKKFWEENFDLKSINFDETQDFLVIQIRRFIFFHLKINKQNFHNFSFIPAVTRVRNIQTKNLPRSKVIKKSIFFSCLFKARFRWWKTSGRKGCGGNGQKPSARNWQNARSTGLGAQRSSRQVRIEKKTRSRKCFWP